VSSISEAFSNRTAEEIRALLTDSAFDSGIIITSPNGLNFRIRFEDED